MKPKLLYVLHSGNLYGTERMALATIQGLRDMADPVLLAPPGAALQEAARFDIETVPFHSTRQLIPALGKQLSRARAVAFFATGVVHSLGFIALNSLLQRPFVHVHLVHGGTDERLSYGRKRWLNGRAVILVAVSEFVKQRLLAHGVRETQVRVIENFLPDEQVNSVPRRKRFTRDGIDRVILVSRVDPIKRIDLLLDMLDQHPDLRKLTYDVYGTGWDLENLRKRAETHHPMVRFHGFSDEIPQAMTRADLLLHLCPEEPFGLAILEAMAAGVPVLVPDRGGAAALVEPNVSGFRFSANAASELSDRLRTLSGLSASELNRIADAGLDRVRTRYSSSARLADYRQLISGLAS